MSELKLIALDAEDLGVLSAHLQDAVLKVCDVVYQPKEKRFAVIVNRFNWPAALAEADKLAAAAYTRHRCAVRFEQVTAARLRGIDLANKDQVLSILAIQFEPHPEENPAGAVTMQFSGGAAIRLEVDYIESELRDLGGAWAAKSKPQHPDDETEAQAD